MFVACLLTEHQHHFLMFLEQLEHELRARFWCVRNLVQPGSFQPTMKRPEPVAFAEPAEGTKAETCRAHVFGVGVLVCAGNPCG